MPKNFPWSSDDLRGKTVEFRLTDSKRTVSGVGIFQVAASPTEVTRLEIEIIEDVSQYKKRSDLFTPTPEQVARLVRHPNQSIAAFQLLV